MRERRVMVPAYEDPILWKGHSSMVDEIKNQLKQKPDAMFCSVGGGGLLGGLIVGCKANDWDDGASLPRTVFVVASTPSLGGSVPLVALETIGSDCFYRSVALNGGRFNSEKKVLPPRVSLVHNEENDVYLAHFATFWSKASGSLGASEPAPGVVKMALERAGGIKTISVPDELSMAALASFAGEFR